MLSVSDDLRNLINADSRSFRARLKNGENAYEQIVSLKKSVIFPSSSMSIGNALSACIECTASDIPVSITGVKFQAEITIQESAEWIKLGSFTAQKPTVTNGNVTFTAYDAMEKASTVTYKSKLNEGTHTAEEYFEDICGALNEPFVALDEASANLEIAEDKLSGYSCRDALAYLAGFLGKNCIVNRDGLFEMVSFKTVNYDMLNVDRIAEPELNDADSIIGYLACCVDEETTLISGEGSTGFEFISPLMTQTRLNELFNQFCGENSPVRVYKAGRITQILGDPTVDICDVISFGYGGTEYVFPVMSLVFDFDGGLQAEIESFALAEPNSLTLSERLSFVQKQAKERTEAYVNAVAEFSQAIQKAYGVSHTVIDGITYFHDTEDINAAGYIYCMTTQGIAFANSWGGSHKDTVWKYGIGKDGDAVLNMLKVFHIKADLIEAGKLTSVDGKTTFDLDEGTVRTKVTGVDENGEEYVKYLYELNAQGVYHKTNPLLFNDSDPDWNEEEQKIIDDYRNSIDVPDNLIGTTIKNFLVTAYKLKLSLARAKAYCVDCADDEFDYRYTFSGNKAIFLRTPKVKNDGENSTEFSVEGINSTEFSVEGIKSTLDFFLNVPKLFLPNNGYFCGKATDGTIIPFAYINANNNTVLGFGGYNLGYGTTNLYGNQINFGVRAGGIGSNNTVFYKPYYEKGDSFSQTMYTSGYLTTSTTTVYFTVPLAKPVIGNPVVSVTSGKGFVLRQSGKYTHGSASGSYVVPSKCDCWLLDCNTVQVRATFSNTTNGINNDNIAIQWDGTITFS